MIVNRYRKKCQSCGTIVEIGKGFAYNNGNGWYTVCASTACHRHLGLKVQGSITDPNADKPERKITVDGFIYMPFDRAALPLLRSMPGAKFYDKDSAPEGKACWGVSIKPADLPRVIEVCTQLELEIPDELRANQGTAESRAAVQRAVATSVDGKTLYDFQTEGVEFLALHDRALLADDMGLGKSVQSLVALPENERVIIVCPAAVKYNWRDEAALWRPEYKVTICNGRDSFVLPEKGEITICNYDILPTYLMPTKTSGNKTRSGKDIMVADITDAQRTALNETTIIGDECFPGDTIISTSNGPLPIGEIVERALPISVISYNGEYGEWKKIVRWIKKPLTNKLVRVVHEFGEFICTPTHKVWTEEGYQEAKSLCGQTLRILRRAISSLEERKRHSAFLFQSMCDQIQQYQSGNTSEDKCQAKSSINCKEMQNLQGELFYSISRQSFRTSEILQHKLLCQMENESARYCQDSFCWRSGEYTKEWSSFAGKESHMGSREDVEKQSNERSGHSREGETEIIGSHISFARREWEIDGTSKELGQCVRVGWIHGVSNSYQRCQGSISFTTYCVQSRYSGSEQKAGDRGRWENTQIEEMEVPGQEEDFNFERSRVVSVEILESGSSEQSSGCIGENSYVYDLEVEDNHNYIANGVLVSNCHLCKNYKAARSKKFEQLARASQRTWLLTGTPLMNNPLDLFGVLCSGNMNVFGSFAKFVQLFNGYPNGYGGYEFPSLPSEEVAERLRRIMKRRLKSEVLKDLPPKTYQDLEVEITADTIKQLDKYLKQVLVENGEDPKKIAKVSQDDLAAKLDLLDLPNFSMFSEVRTLLAAARIPAMLEMVEAYEDSGTPLVVFSDHVKPIEELGKRDGWKIITGDTNPLDRRNIVHEFQEGLLKGIGLTIGAGGTGLTLTRASHVLFVDLNWTPALNIQAEDRVVRIGQNASNVLIMRMRSSHPLDVHIQALLQKKMRIALAALETSIRFKPLKPRKPGVALVEETDEELLARIREAENEAEREISLGRLHGILGRESAKVNDVPEPPLTAGRMAMLRDALDHMIGRCDGAISRDGMGFNKPDAMIARWVGHCLRDEDEVSYRVLERILVRYRKQLKGKFEEIWKPSFE